MNDSQKKAGLGLGIVMLILGLVIGYGVTAIAANHHDKTLKQQITTAQMPAADTKAADLRSSLVTMGVEHMILTDQAVDGALDKSPNATATATALYSNGTDIGAAVGSIYGKDAETTFNSVWKLHLDQFVNYAVADSKGDTTAMATALSTIDTQYTKPLAQYLAKANSNLPEATLESSLGDHVMMTAQMIDDHVKGKYTDESAELAMANKHIAGLFSTLATGIVKQKPALF